MEQTRIYTVELTDEEKDCIVGALHERPAEAGAEQRNYLGRKLERARGEDDGLTLGTHLIRQWYTRRVDAMALDLLQRILAGEVSDLNDTLHEDVDGTDIVIYTYKASAALMASSNDGAMLEETGEAGTTEQQAYFALVADVREELSRLVDSPPDGMTMPEGFDLDDDSTWAVEADESEEGGAV